MLFWRDGIIVNFLKNFSLNYINFVAAGSPLVRTHSAADRQPALPSLAELRAYRLLLLEERRLQGLEALDPDEFAREFRLMTIQRGLKATGTFSYQTAVCDRGAFYQDFVKPTLLIVLQAADWLERFPTLRGMIRERVEFN